MTSSSTIIDIERRAKALRRHVLRMAERVGQGYAGQGLGIADLLAVLYFHELRMDPREIDRPDRDRFVLSIGHYSIALYAALAEKGILPIDELDTYGTDGARLEMSGGEIVPGFEMTGGSLGHGLPQAIGMALGLRLANHNARVFTLLSDGEMQEGSTWEAALAGAHHRLGKLFAFVDYNNQQADGPVSQVMGLEPAEAKWAAFGWHSQRVDGHDVAAIVRAIDLAAQVTDKPHAIVLDTVLGKGVSLFEKRDKAHFIRIEPGEWALAKAQLEGAA